MVLIASVPGTYLLLRYADKLGSCNSEYSNSLGDLQKDTVDILTDRARNEKRMEAIMRVSSIGSIDNCYN